MIFVLLTEVIVGHVVITLLNVKKACLEQTFRTAFCNCRSGFYYCSNNFLHLFIQINFWQSSRANKSCYWYVKRPWRHCRYVTKAWGWVWAPVSLSGPLKSDGNLDRVESMGLKTQSWILQERLQISKAKEDEKTLFKSLSWYYLNRLANTLGLEFLKL